MTHHNIYDEELRLGLKREAERTAAQISASIQAARMAIVNPSDIPPGTKLVRDEDELATISAIEARCCHTVPDAGLCPACWYKHGWETEIERVAGGSDAAEVYRCAADCGWSATLEPGQERASG